jgi:thymidylate synthase (FAD)
MYNMEYIGRCKYCKYDFVLNELPCVQSEPCDKCLDSWMFYHNAPNWEIHPKFLNKPSESLNCKVGTNVLPKDKEAVTEASDAIQGQYKDIVKDILTKGNGRGNKEVLKEYGIDLDKPVENKVEVLDYTKMPICTMGQAAAICYNSKGNVYNIGMDCYKSGHHRVLEFPDITLKLTGWSAKVIRELYVQKIGITCLQASTRYIDYEDFAYVMPPKVSKDEDAARAFKDTIWVINESIYQLQQELDIPKEDASMLLPLAYETTVVMKINLRALLHLAEIRMCTRAFWEFRELMTEIKKAVRNLKDVEWNAIEDWLQPKCINVGYCTEKQCCGKMPIKEKALGKDNNGC